MADLIERRHEADGVASRAVYSPCERYRYTLERIWDRQAPRLTYIMLNPSKATELANDPTIERCQRRAVALGYGAMRISNLFAWRETDPASLKRAVSPVGADTDRLLLDDAAWAGNVLCAWGVHGTHLGRGNEVLSHLRDSGATLFHLGLTKGGLPRHPLYVAYRTEMTRWVL